MADKVLINLATGLEDAERVTIAFLVGGAALERGGTVAMWLTKEAVRLALPGHALGVAVMGARRCRGCSSSSRRAADSCSSARSASTPATFDQASMVGNATIAGATPMLDWLGDDAVAVFSY